MTKRYRNWLAGGASCLAGSILFAAMPARAQAPTEGPLIHVTGGSIFKKCTADRVSTQFGTNFPNTEIEFSLAINPVATSNLLIGMQQDRWSNGGSRGQRAEYSMDATTFHPSSTPNVTKCQGGPWYRSSDPWVSFSPDGTAYFSELVVDELKNPNQFGQSGQTVSQSTDGGATWGLPWTLIISPRTLPKQPQRLNDKNSVTADAFDSRYAYVVWDQLSTYKPGYGYNDENGNDSTGPNANPDVAAMIDGSDVKSLTLRVRDWARAHPIADDAAATVPTFVTGPTLISRTTDHGATWSIPDVAYDPGSNYQTIGNQIVQLPNKRLLDFFARINDLTGATQIGFVVSSDHGKTWSPATLPLNLESSAVLTPNLKELVRSADSIPEMTVDQAHNIIYVVWQDTRFTGDSEVSLSLSPNNGVSWLGPVRVNQTPRNGNPLLQQAFIPSVATAADGTVVVTYYDFRNDTAGGTKDLADHWAVSCNPLTSNDACLSNSDWSTELRVTDTSFDYDAAPFASGHFLGDYMGLKSTGQTVYAAFGQSVGKNLTDLFLRQITVPTGSAVAQR